MESNKLVKTVVIDAPATAVFRALTDERELVRWMPEEAKFDARVGGEYEFRYRWDARGKSTLLKGRIVELVPGRKLSYTWEALTPEGEKRAGNSMVTWELEELADGRTKVTLTHSGIAESSMKETAAGWDYFTGRLSGILSENQ